MIDKIVSMIGGGVLLIIFFIGIIRFYGSLSGTELDMMAFALITALVFGIGFMHYASLDKKEQQGGAT